MDLGLSARVILVISADEALRDACLDVLAEEGALAQGAGEPSGALEAVLDAHGRIDAVVFCLDRHPHSSVLTATAAELEGAWQAVADVVDTLRVAASLMAERGWGRLVSVLPGEVKWLHEGADELGLITGLGVLGLNKAAVADLAPTGVAVNAVLRGEGSSPAEVADAVAFLCSEGAGYLHGITISLDGADSPAVF